MLQEKLRQLAAVRSEICISITLPTHRTHPDCVKDGILLKNLVKEAELQLLNEHTKRKVQPILKRLTSVVKEVDVRHNLDSLHIYISQDTTEIIRLAWPVTDSHVHIGHSFNIRSLITAYNRSAEYLILVVSQAGAQLYDALNDSIQQEINEHGFPFEAAEFAIHGGGELSDSFRMDNLVREHLNRIDKAVTDIHHQTGLMCAVVCTSDNYSKLLQVADKAGIYIGNVAINYNDTSVHKIARDTWMLIRQIQEQQRSHAIREVEEAVKEGKVITDIREIARASFEGRGELLIANHSFKQSAKYRGEGEIELLDNSNAIDTIEDVTGDIAWAVLSKKGRVFFTPDEEGSALGPLALKVRY
jgi:hypothetical protein